MMMGCDRLEAYQALMRNLEPEGLKVSIADPRHHTDIILQALEGDAFDEVHVAQFLEQVVRRIEVALDL